MTSKYNNLFVGVYNSVRGTPLSAWVLILSVILLAIGINNFVEDTYSSYAGIQMIEQKMNMQPATWGFTYWAMSLFFQVIAVIAFFIYLSDRQSNWWWMWVAVGSQVIDFVADVWYRSNAELFVNPVKFFVSLVLTFVFFTAGSELAVTIGFGLVATMFKDGFTQVGQIISGLLGGVAGAGKAIAGGKTLVDEHQRSYQKPPIERDDIPEEIKERMRQFNEQRQQSKEPVYSSPQRPPNGTHPQQHQGGKPGKNRNNFRDTRRK